MVYSINLSQERGVDGLLKHTLKCYWHLPADDNCNFKKQTLQKHLSRSGEHGQLLYWQLSGSFLSQNSTVFFLRFATQ